MMSLFSSFDYYWGYNFKFSELYLMFPLICFYFNNSFLFLFSKLKNFLLSFFGSLLPMGFSMGSIHFFFSVMFLVLFLNFFSVFPFNFAHTSQASTVFSYGLGVWLTVISFNFIQNLKGLGSHLVPEGSPIFLVPALFMIEFVSNIIRPITLSVRLLANILAGHLLLILLSKVIFSSSIFYPLFFGLTMVEFFVAMVQSYIFVTMIVLYYCDLH